MRKKNPRTNIVSMRITDDEFEDLQQLMKLTRKKASDILREGFGLLRTDWDRVLAARKSAPVRNLAVPSALESRSAGTAC